MTSKLNPLRACRNLSAQPRRALLPRAAPRVPVATCIAARRHFSDDTNNTGGGDGNPAWPPNEDYVPPNQDYMPPNQDYVPPNQDYVPSNQDYPQDYAPSNQDYAPNHYEPPPPEHFAPTYLNAEAVARLKKIAAQQALDDEREGYLFDLPARIGPKDKLQDRYSPVITQVTKLMMRDGKLSKAQRNMSMVLDFLRKTPAPKISPMRPLLPGAPPPEQLPLNPELFLTLAIDSVAPLLRIRSIKGAGGGGAALEIPEPLPARQRRRIATMWLLDTVERKKSRGSGRAMFAHRIAEELIGIVEGRSSVWDKRQIVHKLGTASRANLNHPAITSKRK